jgi:hypothetical protein
VVGGGGGVVKYFGLGLRCMEAEERDECVNAYVRVRVHSCSRESDPSSHCPQTRKTVK